nr:spermidine synthase [uncultured Limnohabitans sp.]
MDTFSHLTLSFTTIDPIEALLACAAAIAIGAWLARKQAQAFKGKAHNQMTNHDALGFPPVTVAEYGDMRFLHLGTPAVQGSMKISQPFEIHLDYVQRMMGWLLFADLDRVNHMHAMQLGLGAAALTKFCHRQLRMQTTAIELNPQVIATCRRCFELPADDARLRVVLSDAARAVKSDIWRANVDVLQVDLYDQDAARPVLDSEDFYRDCRNLLTQEGCLIVNLFGHNANKAMSLKNLSAAFGQDALWTFKPTPSGNTIVLGFHTPRELSHAALLRQAQMIETRWSLPATKWLKVLNKVSIEAKGQTQLQR